ncbi:MAG: hypothetical protein JSS46_09515 [Proteobacteria bacterium]|jgi:hypothetical protein|nr:hypothetical protein [Pseudomonadota bacterium]
MPAYRNRTVTLAALALAAWSGIADAQWVFLARRAVGRIEQMSQQAPDGKTAFDTATVIVDVPAARVYETVQESLKAAAGITITSDDGPTRRVAFTDGTRSASIQSISLGDRLTQILVSSAHAAGADATTSTIVARIVGVCRRMNVECTPGS